MDIKHVLSCNPMHPAYRSLGSAGVPADGAARSAGSTSTPAAASSRSATPAPASPSTTRRPATGTSSGPFRIADRLVTAGEWLAFIDDGGYERPELWLSEGWATVQADGWDAPLYWQRDGDAWQVFTLARPRAARPARAGVHVSFFEADAYARWAGARLPTEAEWEAARPSPAPATQPNDLRPGRCTPAPRPRARRRCSASSTATCGSGPSSPYGPYPGFRPAAGRHRRVQRQVHVQPDGAAGRLAASPPPATPARPTATSSRRRPAGRSAACAWPPTPERRSRPAPRHPSLRLDQKALPRAQPADPHRRRAGDRRPPHPRRPAPPSQADVRRGSRRAGPSTLPPEVVLRRPGQRALRRDHPAARVLPDRAASGRSSTREAATIAAASGADTLVELGSGTSDKTRILLDAFAASGQLRRFVPFDVSEGILRWSAAHLAERYPGLEVHGVVGDFDHHLHRSPPADAGWSRSSAARSATTSPPTGPGCSPTWRHAAAGRLASCSAPTS